MTATRKKQWVCSGKETARRGLCENPVSVWHLWGQGGSSLSCTFQWDFVKEGEGMPCQHEQGKLLHMSERAEDEEGRRARISAVEKASGALKGMNSAGNSISGVQKSVAR